MRRWRRAGRALRTVGIIAKAGQSDLSRFFYYHVSSLLLEIPFPNTSSAAATSNQLLSRACSDPEVREEGLLHEAPMVKIPLVQVFTFLPLDSIKSPP